MGKRLISLAVAFTILLALAPALSSQEKTFLSKDRALEGGNNIYRIFIEDSKFSGRVGTFTVGTATGNSVPHENILFGAFDPPASPGSSYLTVRSYTTQTDYVSQKDVPDSSFTVFNLNSYGIVSPLTNGFRTEWILPGPPTTPDALTIIQDTVAQGSTQEDSAVQVTTRIINRGVNPTAVGIRYLWDLKIGNIDEAWFRTLGPVSAWTQDFFDFFPPDFDAFETVDDPAAPLFSIYGTVNGDFGLVPTPSDPDRFMYASWLVGFNRAWDFTVGGGGLESAVLYFWGAEEAQAMVLPENGEVAKTAYLATVLFGDEEPEEPATVPALDLYGGIILVALLGALLVLKKRAA